MPLMKSITLKVLLKLFLVIQSYFPRELAALHTLFVVILVFAILGQYSHVTVILLGHRDEAINVI